MFGVHLSHHTSSPPPIHTAAPIHPVPHHTWYWWYCDRDEYKIQHVHCTVHQSFLLFLGPFDCTIPIPRIQMFLDVHTSTRIMKVLKNVPSLSGPQGGRCGRAEGHHKPLQSPGPQLARPAPIRRRWNKSRHCRSELRDLSLSPTLAWPATNNQHDKRLHSDRSGTVELYVLGFIKVNNWFLIN